MRNERNRTVARFEHKGKHYTIHERKNKLSNGQWCSRRFICEGDQWCGWANNVREARKVLDLREEDAKAVNGAEHSTGLSGEHAEVLDAINEASLGGG